MNRKNDILKCYGTTEITEDKRAINTEVMDDVSQALLERIIGFSLPLTSIHINFNRSIHPYIGCGEGERVKDLTGNKSCCKKGGNHTGEVDLRPGSSYELDSVINFRCNWTLKRSL